MFRNKIVFYAILIAFATIVVNSIVILNTNKSLKEYSQKVTEKRKHIQSPLFKTNNGISLEKQNKLKQKDEFFLSRQEMLLFANKTINQTKNNESSKFSVYLFQNLNIETPNKSFISEFTMPFTKFTNPFVYNPDTEYYWYTFLETGNNKWMFVNMTNSGFTTFDISYSPEQRKLKTGKPEKMQYSFFEGFITDFDPVENFFVTDEGFFYDKDGNILTQDKRFSGIGSVK